MILNKPLEGEELEIQPNKKTFSEDKERVIAVYAGIFPHNIHEYANRIVPKFKHKKNYSK